MKVFRLSSIAVVAAAVVGFTSAASAAVLFERALPNINLNDAAGANRSNVNWTHFVDAGNTYIPGDDFTVGSVGQQYIIDKIVVWGAQLDPLDQDIDNLSLYVGKTGSTLNRVATGAVTGNNNSNPNITHVRLPAYQYQGTSGDFFPVFEATFNLGLPVDGGVMYDFGVYGDDFGWFLHASNAALSGTTQDGDDGAFLDLLLSADESTAEFFALVDSSVVDPLTGQSAWDKQSDINVRIEGRLVPPTGVPEPSSLALFGIALAGLAASRRRKS